MRKLFVLVAALALSASIWSQETKTEGYQFTTVKANPITSIKNQANSGTCWSWSGLAFLESELLRTGKGEHDLSAMYIARRNYADQAEKYVRLNGALNYSQGGSFADVVETLDEYGVIPLEIYQGLNYGTENHAHSEVANGLTAYVEAINKKPNKTLSTAWMNGLNGILDAYFGAIPTEFDYKGKKYTPQSLAKELGLKNENYISLTSYSHHPFYAPYAVEVADNWRWALSYNLPIDELMEVFDYAINQGYTIAWASDVSEIGFTRNGIAVIPDDQAEDNIGSDQAHWLGLSKRDRDDQLRTKLMLNPVKEKEITQEMRQVAFDIQETTDDHGMQIYGIAKDQNGTKYYMVKNSWGKTGNYEGIWYASESFVKYKTMSIVINKESLPKEIAKKLGLK